MIATQTRRQFMLASIVAGFVISVVMVWNASAATFIGKTANPGDSWHTAAVVLSDDDASNTRMFNLTGLAPGDSGQRCIVVSYTGTTPAPVRMYTKTGSYTGTLGGYLTLTISEGSGGTYADATCSNWSSGAQLYSGLMSSFATTKTDFTSGVANSNGPWTPYAATQTKAYKVAWSLASTAPNSTENTSAGIGFTWEAQATAPGATNLALGATATGSATGSCSASETPAKAVNGSVSDGTSDKFCTSAATKYLQVDLGATRTITSFTVRHAAAGGEAASTNTKDYDIDVSNNGSSWTNVVQARTQNAAVTSHSVSTSGRYVKITLLTPEQGAGGNGRIYEFEVYGT